MDVIKERLQVQSVQMRAASSSSSSANNGTKFSPYRGSVDAFITICKNEGVMRGLYKGYGITLLSFGPFSALYFWFYEEVDMYY